MRRLLMLLLCLTILVPSFSAVAEEEPLHLVIAVTSESDAQNLPIEEASRQIRALPLNIVCTAPIN